MSQFSGKQHKGAMRERRAAKRAQAELRNSVAECRYFGSRHRGRRVSR